MFQRLGGRLGLGGYERRVLSPNPVILLLAIALLLGASFPAVADQMVKFNLSRAISEDVWIAVTHELFEKRPEYLTFYADGLSRREKRRVGFVEALAILRKYELRVGYFDLDSDGSNELFVNLDSFNLARIPRADCRP